MNVYATAKTDVGRVRERNEDAFLVHDELGLYAVADGMGGHNGGAHASRLTTKTLASYVAAHKDVLTAAGAPAEDDISPPLARLLAEAVRAACAAVFDAAAADASLAGMGTTCTVMLLRPGWAYVAHVGDSRCYIQRGSRFMQVTEDHSLVNEQVRAGLLRPEEAAHSRHKNIITRSVGFEREVEVDTFLVPLEQGDQFLLCSDGLSNLVDNTELGEAMMAMQGDALADFLVNVALERGGDDNVTVVTLKVDDATLPLPQQTDADLVVTEPLGLVQTAPNLPQEAFAGGQGHGSDGSPALDTTTPPLAHAVPAQAAAIAEVATSLAPAAHEQATPAGAILSPSPSPSPSAAAEATEAEGTDPHVAALPDEAPSDVPAPAQGAAAPGDGAGKGASSAEAAGPTGASNAANPAAASPAGEAPEAGGDTDAGAATPAGPIHTDSTDPGPARRRRGRRR